MVLSRDTHQVFNRIKNNKKGQNYTKEDNSQDSRQTMRYYLRMYKTQRTEYIKNFYKLVRKKGKYL
jgi:hypothetical protein